MLHSSHQFFILRLHSAPHIIPGGSKFGLFCLLFSSVFFFVISLLFLYVGLAFSFYCQNHISSKLVLAYIIFGYFAGTSDAEAMPVPATGENIPTAMATAENDAVLDAPIPATPLALEGDSTVDVSPTRDSEIAMRAGGSPAVTEQTSIPTSSSIQQAAMNRVLLGQMGNSVTDVEIGGGKIQGREIIPGRGQIQFAMYNARQYEKPEGHFTEQTSRDGEKWYKVYATTRVEKTPTVQDERGRMQYDERKVAAMPKAPARRH